MTKVYALAITIMLLTGCAAGQACSDFVRGVDQGWSEEAGR